MNPLADRLARYAHTAHLPEATLQIMRLCLFDWATCAVAGARSDVARVVRAQVAAEGGTAQASVVGLASMAVPARAAALANGAISHALDYDDTHFAHIGHPSVVVLSAALAAAERHSAPGRAVLEAGLIGAEVSVRIGCWLGESHAAAGFHTTATAGAFGAGIAVARLSGLSVEETRHMLGLLASRASGLRAQFGSMGKAMNAGFAASSGLEAADLAAAGLTSHPEALDADDGFLTAHSGAGDTRAFRSLGTEWRMDQISFKAHACCHGLHAMLDALGNVRLTPSDIDRVTVRTHPRWIGVCSIEAPATGLEAKFSYRLTAAMALAGWDTAALDTFSDAACADPVLLRLRDKVDVVPDRSLATTAAVVDVTATGGRAHRLEHDIAAPVALSHTLTRLRAKAYTLLGQEDAERVEAATLAANPDPAALAGVLRAAGM